MKNKKGFTLIELLAVIVILGILMMVAIPAIASITENARKDTYGDNARAFIAAVRRELVAGTMSNGSGGVVTLPDAGYQKSISLFTSDGVPFVKLEQGGVDSPYGINYDDTSYVTISADANGIYTYSICLVDTSGNGTSSATSPLSVTENSLSRETFKTSMDMTAGCVKPADGVVTP